MTAPLKPSDMPELKACPFCGGEAVLFHLPTWDKEIFCKIRCTNLSCKLENGVKGSWSEKDAIKAWNTRADLVEQAAIDDLTIADYKASFEDHNRLVKELDIALNGEYGAAEQASLCDIVSQVVAAALGSDRLTQIIDSLEHEARVIDNYLPDAMGHRQTAISILATCVDDFVGNVRTAIPLIRAASAAKACDHIVDVNKLVSKCDKLVQALDKALDWLGDEMFDDDDKDSEGMTQEERAENISDVLNSCLAEHRTTKDKI